MNSYHKFYKKKQIINSKRYLSLRLINGINLVYKYKLIGAMVLVLLSEINLNKEFQLCYEQGNKNLINIYVC